jgi:hypothetical protein
MHELCLVPFAWIWPGLKMLARTNMSASRTLSPAEISFDASGPRSEDVRIGAHRRKKSSATLTKTWPCYLPCLSDASRYPMELRVRDLLDAKEPLLVKDRKTQAIGTSPSRLRRHAAPREFRIVLRRRYEKMRRTFYCRSPRMRSVGRSR